MGIQRGFRYALALTMIVSFNPFGAAGVDPLQRGLAWLERQVTPLVHESVYDDSGSKFSLGPAPAGATAVKSFEFSSNEAGRDEYERLGRYARSFVYDNAITAIAFLTKGDTPAARGILLGLNHLARAGDGLGFSFNTSGDNFYQRGNIRSGAVAWAGYAAVLFEAATGSDEFRELAEKQARFLLARQVNAHGDPRDGLITAGRILVKTRSGYKEREADWAATEHQIDAYFFLRDLAVLTGSPMHRQAASRVREGLLTRLWSDREGRFHVAAHPTGINEERALDASSWGAVFLISVGEKKRARKALEFVERHFRSSHRGLDGYRPYSGRFVDYPDVDWSRTGIVWGEGSLGVALAYRRIGNAARADRIIARFGQGPGSAASGGVVYSTGGVKDFPDRPSVASTAWLVLAADMVGPRGVRIWS